MTTLKEFNGKKLIHEWVYRNAAGREIGRVARYQNEADGRKDYVPHFIRTDAGFRVGKPEKPFPLFGLDILATCPFEAPVFVVEGEKCAAALQSLGRCAVTSLFGAGSVRRADWKPLSGREILYLFPDADEAGENYCQSIAEIAASLPLPPKIYSVHLPNLEKGQDICDWISQRVEGWNQYEPVPEKYREKLISEIEWVIEGICLKDEGIKTSAKVANREWPDRVSLALDHEEEAPYPVDALPEEIAAAVISYQAYAKQPFSLVATSALANLSLATQGVADVARDSVLTGPSSLFTLVVAESGERKTSCDREFGRGIREWEEEQRIRLQPQVEDFKAKEQMWKAEIEGIEAKIKRESGKRRVFDDGTEIDDLKVRLAHLVRTRPRPVRVPNFFHESFTQEKLAMSLAEGWPSSSIWSDEGALLVGSIGWSEQNMLKQLGLLNRLWDANEFRYETKGSGDVLLSHRRVTCCLMLQFGVLRELVGARNGLSRGTGFLARMLIAYPASSMGERFYSEPPAGNSWEVQRFHTRLKEILNMGLAMDENGRLVPYLLHLSPEAKEAWISYFNRIEHELRPRGDFIDVKDFASKSAENAARIAACFHVYQHGEGGCITAKTMLAGIRLAEWYLRESRRLFGQIVTPEAVKDARILWDWIKRSDRQEFFEGEIAHSGPNALRKDRKARTEALAILIDRGVIERRQESQQKVKIIVDQNALSLWQ